MKQRVVWLAVLLVAVLGVPFSVWAATPRQTPTKAPLAVQATVRVVESVPVAAPAVAVTATAVTCDPLTTRSLYGWFTSNTTGSVYNSSYTCAFEVGIAAYSMFDDRIGNQQLFDYTMYTVAPRQTINLNVKIPDCKAQLDIFRGPVLHSLVGQRYGERLLSTRFPNTTLCAPPVEEVCSQGQISRLSGVSNNQLVTGVLNIQAEVTGALPQKVEFALTGAQTASYTDVNSPYYFMGNNGSQPNGWDSSTKPEGDYRLSATYVGLFGESLAIRCEPVAVNFSIRRSTPTAEPTATNTPVPTATNTPVPTATNTPLPTATNTPVPTATNTPVPTATNTPVPTATNTPVPTATNTPVPTATNTPVPTATNTPVPTSTPVPGNQCVPQGLGTAGDFNVFTFGNITQSNTDIEGRVAAGGNINFQNFGVGVRLTNSNGTRDDLVAGGSLTYTNGSVYNGNVVYGTTKSLNGVSVLNGTVRQGQPIKFYDEQTYLRSRSQAWGALSANGTTVYEYGAVKLNGTNPTLNIFTVDGAQLNNANGLHINVPASASVLINITGTNNRMQYFETFLTNVDQTKIVYNFYQATSFSLAGIGIKGTILAPFADVSFDNGQINGTLIGNSLIGGGESHHYPFNGCLPYLPANKSVER